MTDTELIDKLEGYGTEIIIQDDEGNEYDITKVSICMGGQFHPLIKIKKCPHKDNFFRDKNQCIADAMEKIKLYKSYLEQMAKENYDDEFKARYNNLVKREIEHNKNLIKYYEEL